MTDTDSVKQFHEVSAVTQLNGILISHMIVVMSYTETRTYTFELVQAIHNTYTERAKKNCTIFHYINFCLLSTN